MLRRRNYTQKSLPPIRCNKGQMEKKISKTEERGVRKELSQTLEKEKSDPKVKENQLRKPTKTESRDRYPPRKIHQKRRETGERNGRQQKTITKNRDKDHTPKNKKPIRPIRLFR